MKNDNRVNEADIFEPSAKLLTSGEAAKLLGLTNKNTLSVWRTTKRYHLPFVKVGRLVRYIQKDIEDFINRNVQGGLNNE